jgi:hypothetical protein|tara:strand:- start:249 stop:428 length:180 start_codon:yes stop_codon:yes gene_type:complete
MSKQNIPQETIDKIKEYVTKNFSKTFKNKPIIIVEKENHFTVTPHKDFGPIILSKNILK